MADETETKPKRTGASKTRNLRQRETMAARYRKLSFAELEEQIAAARAALPPVPVRGKASVQTLLTALEHERGLRVGEPLHEIGQRLHEARLARGLTQKQLGDECDVHTDLIGRLEKGVETHLTLPQLKRICEFLGQSPNTLMYGKSGFREGRRRRKR